MNLQRTDNAAIQFYLNTQIAPALQLSTSGKTVNVITADKIFVRSAPARRLRGLR